MAKMKIDNNKVSIDIIDKEEFDIIDDNDTTEEVKKKDSQKEKKMIKKEKETPKKENNISNTSSAELAEAFSRTANSAADAGIEFGNLAKLITKQQKKECDVILYDKKNKITIVKFDENNISLKGQYKKKVTIEYMGEYGNKNFKIINVE